MKQIKNHCVKAVLILVAFSLGYLSVNFEPIKKITDRIVDRLVPKVEAQGTFAYYYPQVQSCYRFNIILRINAAFGFDPIQVSDVFLDGVQKTVVEFDRQLTAEQETSLNAIMADSPEFPPANAGTKFEQLDLYENRALLTTKFNLSFQVYYSCDGSKIFVFFGKTLTQGEKNTVNSEFSKLLSEKAIITP